ncbi:DegT/DnrJ/EryC1/StrS family aminotransferase [Helicobacter sp. faydin-H20]|uniref:DegT/DnrJ/EryC1/StrS family aminotransferase n=1 Tax=Helicobacter anatolicus TaxID=2905874 RepID=UPI001E3E9875|nr:DegT/DnrJ/EryC1/StrS family aminotransferase [Helicobacter anatolicus]MCE3037109.1 DegT/DnrJ/EryC1/StrS family aminotransferase [Helicobacter anatolicus]
MEVKFLDLTFLNKPYFVPFLEQMQDILYQSSFINGEYNAIFEKNFAKFIGVENCIGVGNGTDALEIAIKALNLPKGSHIIVPANTFKASCEAILNMGYKAVIIDCDENYNISIKSLKSAITPQTSAILIVHLYGRICDMLSILEVARNYNLAIIEDCSQAHGAKIKIDNEVVCAGSIGDIATFSFYPSKNLGAIGDAGCIVTQSSFLSNRCRNIANHHQDSKEKLQFIGRNSRLDHLQAMFLNLKLKDLESHNQYRQNLANYYQETLQEIEQIVLPEIPTYSYQCVWHLYVIRLQKELEGKREELQNFLQQNGIQTHIHYPQNLSKIKEIRMHINTIINPTPNANHWDENILSLPIGIHITKEHIIYIAEKIQAFIANLSQRTKS